MALLSGRSRIPELSGIRFTGHESVARYADALRNLMRDISYEVDFASEELYAVLRRQQGHPLLFGVDVKLRARKVCKRLRRCHQLCGGAAVESVKFYTEFRHQFGDVIQPPPKPKKTTFDFNDHH
jgi:hypothetical protein